MGRRSGGSSGAAGLAAWYQTPDGRTRGDECTEAPLPRTSQPPGQPLRHEEGRGINSAEGAPVSWSADVAEEKSTEVTAPAADQMPSSPTRPARWSEMTRSARNHWGHRNIFFQMRTHGLHAFNGQCDSKTSWGTGFDGAGVVVVWVAPTPPLLVLS